MSNGTPAASYLRGLVAARTQARAQGLNVESVRADSAGPDAKPHTDDVLARVQETMDRMPAEDMGDPDEFRRALTTLLQQADRTLRKLDVNPAALLERHEVFTVEAVIRTDGTRPSLLVRNDRVNPDHPMAGAWRDTLFAIREKVADRAASIGRIEPEAASSSNFFGTGWLVDAAKGVILTNLHVLEAISRSLPAAVQAAGNGFRFLPGKVFIDFAAESGSLVKKRFQIVEATPSGIDGTGFVRLDIAAMRIEEIKDVSPAMPEAIPVLADFDGPQGNLSSFCVVGYPGPPQFTTGVHEGVDWTWITATLFGGRFGVKRLAPGQAHKPLGTLAGDSQLWVFGHDATTLGGSSGSPVISWLNQNAGAFGIHFAGQTVETNCAHALGQCREKLESLGITVQDVL